MLPFDLEEYLKKNYKPSTSEASETEIAEAVGVARAIAYGAVAYVDTGLPRKLAKAIKKAVDNYKKENEVNNFIDDIIKEKVLGSFSDVCVKCGVREGTFNKIYNQKQKDTQRQTILALCIGLKLTLMEAEKFLSLLGYKFREWNLQEIIVKCFIENKCYDIHELNIALMAHGEEPVPKQRFLKEKVSSKKIAN